MYVCVGLCVYVCVCMCVSVCKIHDIVKGEARAKCSYFATSSQPSAVGVICEGIGGNYCKEQHFFIHFA